MQNLHRLEGVSMLSAQVPIDELDGLAQTLSNTDVAIILGVVLLLVVATGWRMLSMFSRYLDQQRQDAKERQVSQERLTNAVQQLGQSEAASNKINESMAELLTQLTEHQKRATEITEYTRQATIDTHDALKNGFKVTGQQIDELPGRIAKQLQPLIAEIRLLESRSKELSEKLEDARRDMLSVVRLAEPSIIQIQPQVKPQEEKKSA